MLQSSRNALVLSLLKRIRRRELIGKSCASFILDASPTDTHQLKLSRNQKRPLSSFGKNIGQDSLNHTQRKFKNVQQAVQAVRQLIIDVDSSGGRQMESQRRIFDGVEQVFGTIVAQVDEGSLNPSGKHGKDLSRFFEFILYAYSQVDVPGISLFDKSEQVLDTLKQWNLDVRSRHYEYAIISANREGKYKEAADLFLREIDPEAGYNPISVSLDAPHGLVAIALCAQQQGHAVAEQVFDAVLKLSMVSPSDLPQYTLAAGTALGKAGEWESAIKYLYESEDARKFGQPIISAVMQACLMCNRPDVALDAFDHGINDLGTMSGGEWQWGGGRDRVDPLCRDMAMRAMKGKRGTSDMALDFVQQVMDEDVSISIDALQGVTGAYEHDEDLGSTLGFLLYIIENRNRPNWIVDGTKQEIQELHSVKSGESLSESDWTTKMGPLVASVMRTYNKSSNFGTAMFCLLLIDNAGALSFTEGQTNETTLTMKISKYLSAVEFSDDLLIATMHSLCGLRLYQIAMNVFETAESSMQMMGSRSTMPRVVSDRARSVYHFAVEENSKHGTVETGNPAIHAIFEIERLVKATKSYENKTDDDVANQREGLVANLADAMKACTYIRQSDLSFVLFNWVSIKLKGAKYQLSSLHKISNQVELDDEFAMQSDSLLAEVVNARKWNSSPGESNNVFELLQHNNATDLKDWANSVNAGVPALLAKGDGDAALQMFNALGKNAMNPELFVVIANHLAKEQQWIAVKDLYDTAVKENCYSEDLSTIAMKAVVSSEVENRIIVLREMVEKAAESNGANPDAWLREQYWTLKRSIGFKYARLLMWWNDPSTCHLDELNFAIEEINDRTASGTDVRYDTIRTIVNSAKKGLGNDNLEKYRWIPSDVEQWKELLELVVYQAQLTNHLDPRMIDEIVRCYIALDCREDCIHFVVKSLHNGARVNKFSLHQALEAAHLESSDAVSDLQMMIAR